MLTGPNQHFIPQTLLRRFRNSAKGIARVHVYRADRAYISPTTNVAAQRNFYSKGEADEGEPLDTVITRHENGPFNDDFNALTNLPAGPVDAALAARVVAHLVGRGDHLRGMIRSGTAAISDFLGELFGDRDNFARLIGADGPLPGPRFREVFDESMADNSQLLQLGLPRPVVEALSYMMLRESRQSARDETGELALAVADRFRAAAPGVARQTQLGALTTSHTPDARVEQLAAFRWRIVDVPEPGAVLPDFVVLARDAGELPGSIFAFGPDELAELLMPLSPTRMLVGQLVERDPGIDRFNDEAIPLCLDFFVSAFASDALAASAADIGREIDAPARAGLEAAASEFRARLSGTSDAPAADAGDWRHRVGRGFELETDNLSSEDAERLGAVLLRLVQLARERFDTDNLRRFVVRADYAATFAAVDRGAYDDGTPLVPSSEGVSLAYNVVVEYEGEPGIVTVLHAGVVDMLLSNDDLEFAAAASTVLGQLARIGADQLLGTVFATGMSDGEEHDRLILETAIWVWKSWQVAKYRAMFSDEVRDEYREQVLERLVSVGERLTEARRVYRLDGDLDRFVEIVVAAATETLSVAACAAAASADDDATLAFRAALEAAGWSNWFALLERDLTGIWTEGSAYPEQSAFLVIARHVQRLLVAGAIFFWSPPEGQVKVEVPYWSDLAWIAEQLRARDEDDPTDEAPGG